MASKFFSRFFRQRTSSKRLSEGELHFEEAVFDNLVYGTPDYLELPTSKRTFLLVAAGTLVLVLAIIGKIGFLNILSRGFYEERASANVSREIALPANRALIVDRFGEPLAENKNSFSVFLNLPLLINSEERLHSAVGRLAETLDFDSGMFLALIRKADLEQTNWITVARNITPAQAIAVKGLNDEALVVLNDFERRYLEAPVFSHILGYTGISDLGAIVGKSGAEFFYDREIRGQDGRYVFFEDALGKVLGERILSEPKSKPPFELTLDAGLQKFFYQSLKRQLEFLGRDYGAGLALNPQTGEILALVSFPEFDSNVFVDGSRNLERKLLLQDPKQPLFNRVLTGVYSPGSTVKPLVALAALRESVVKPETRINSLGALTIPNPYYPDEPSVFLDWKPHGWVDLKDALAKSSNIYFYLVGGGLAPGVPQELVDGGFAANGLGVGQLRDYWQKFGFGVKTEIDLPFEGAGFLPEPDEKETRSGEPWRLGDTYNVSIGQGDLLTTPLQLLNFIASIGNGGKIYRPFVRKGRAPEVLINYSDFQNELQAVKSGLEAAVSESYGSAHILSNLPISVAGKTGTPQIQNNAKVNAIFAGYAPADDPEIAILVLIENAREGSFNALPVARDVFRWYYENRLRSR